jgi:hypothetical protein
VKVGPDVFLEHERLDVYRTAVEFDALASQAVPRRGHRILRDQLDWATIGIALDSRGRRSALGPEQRFYEMACRPGDWSVPKAMLRLGSFWCASFKCSRE